MSSFEHLTLETPRLRVRPLREADAADMFEIFSDAEVMRYWSTPAWTEMEQASTMIERGQKGMAAGAQVRLGLEDRQDGRLIGTCTLFALSPQCRRAEIGYALARRAWGHAFMDEALRALLDWGFAQLNLHRIEADIDPRNTASARTLERLGFKMEGHLRERWIVGDEISDSALYGLLQREWHWRA